MDNLLINLIDQLRTSQFSGPTYEYTFEILDPNGRDFFEIVKFINDNRYVIDRIDRITNLYIFQLFNNQRRTKAHNYGSFTENWLFFGTKQENIDYICRYNLIGGNAVNRFWMGINFSPSFDFAASYCDPNSFYKVMVLANVLIGKSCVEYNEPFRPPQKFDTNIRRGGKAIVKYEDDEYYPAFLIFFHKIEDLFRLNPVDFQNRQQPNQMMPSAVMSWQVRFPVPERVVWTCRKGGVCFCRQSCCAFACRCMNHCFCSH